MDSMTEFMSRELIKEKIDEISTKFFDFQIVDEKVIKSVEDDLQTMISTLSNGLAEKGDLSEVWPVAIGWLMDTIVAQLITIKLQNKFIEQVNLDSDE